MVKKKNYCMPNRKKRFTKLCALIESLLFLCPQFSLFLLSFFVPAFVLISVTTLVFCPRSPTILLSCCISAPFFCPGSLAVLLFYYIPDFLSYFGFFAVLSFYSMSTPAAFRPLFLPCHAFVFDCKISAFLLLLLAIDSLFLLISLSLGTFERCLSNKF